MNVVCMLVNNLEFFKYFLNYSDIKNSKCKFVFFNEQRIGDKVEEMKEILEKSELDNYKVFGSDLVIDKFREVTNCDSSFLHKYTMGMNILMQWFVFKFLNVKENINILSLDDDIILLNDFESLFDNKSKFRKDSLRKAHLKLDRKSKKMLKIAKTMFEVFDKNFDSNTAIEKMNKDYFNGGQFILSNNDIDIDIYEKGLVNFFNCKYFENLWNKRRSHTTYQFDERFMIALAQVNNSINDDLRYETKMLCFKTEKIKDITIRNIVKSRKIIHICNRSGKYELYERVLRIIKEEKENGHATS